MHRQKNNFSKKTLPLRRKGQEKRKVQRAKSKESASKKRNPLYHSDPLDPSAVAGAWNKRNSNN